MTRTLSSLFALLLICAAPLAGCGDSTAEAPAPAPAPAPHASSLTEGVAAAALAPRAAAETSRPAPAAAMAPAGPLRTGTVKETADAAGYVYVLMGTDAGDVWIAAPDAPVEVGSRVEAPIGSEMRDFKSSALNRTFDVVFFTSFVRPEGSAAAAAASTGAPADATHGSMGAGAAPPPEMKKIEPLADGLTVAGVFTQPAGTDVAVRGLVVKVNRGILGFDWVHLQDGTGDAASKTADLLVTAAMGTAQVKPGDVAVARGKVATDKDFGAGYAYALLVEGATLTVE